MLKIKWFLSHPIQYFSPLLRKLATRSELDVYYYSDISVRGGQDKDFGINVKWDTDLLGGYPHHFVKNNSKHTTLNNRFLDAVNPGVISVIRKGGKSVSIVNGWSYCSDLLVIFFSRVFGKKVWLRAENPLNQETGKSGAKRFVKKLFLEYILFKLFVNKVLYIGKENKKFFAYYGVPEERMIYTPYCVDNDFFSQQAGELRTKSEEIKRQLQIPTDKKIILFAGKYIGKKNPLDLLKAFQKLNNADYALVMVGEGVLRKEMEVFISAHDLKHVYLTGFVNQSAISKYYSVADVFVMCSGNGETWGLSVNEAMNFGKPIVVSDTTGCSSDLVLQGINGFVFPEGNSEVLADCIKKVLDDDSFREQAGRRSIEIVGNYSIDKVVENLVAELG